MNAPASPTLPVFRRTHPELGAITVSTLDPTGDLDTIVDWVRQPGAEFWGLGELSRDELRETYELVDSLSTHHAFLVRRDDLPVALLQTYEPEFDPVGECYQVEPGDLGFHFLLGARGPAVRAFTTQIGQVLFGFLFSDPDVLRLVIEPDAANDRALARMLRFGFEPGPIITIDIDIDTDTDPKTAQLAFLSRESWLALPTHPTPHEGQQ